MPRPLHGLSTFTVLKLCSAHMNASCYNIRVNTPYIGGGGWDYKKRVPLPKDMKGNWTMNSTCITREHASR